MITMATGLELIGDPAAARQRLGPTVPVALFRALRVVGMMEGLDAMIGSADTLVYSAGKPLGLAIGAQVKSAAGGELADYLARTAEKMAELGVGLVSAPEIELERGRLVLQVDECVTCSGMPVIGRRICHFEAGMVAGLVEAFAGATCRAEEIACNADGDDACRFEVRIGEVRS